MLNFKYYFAKSITDFIKQREKKEGIKNIFFKKVDKNFFELSREQQIQRLIKILESQGFKIKK
tara:strand:+ start:285 stop:473 length:189 start_codon:yes stop_codon:yes gene_type:complete